MTRRAKQGPGNGIQQPQVPSRLITAALSSSELVDGATLSGHSLTSRDLPGVEAEDVLFERSHLQHVILSQTVFPRAQLIDLCLDTCDLSAVDWEKAYLRRVQFEGCRILGAKLLNGSWEDTIVKDCNVEFAMFWSTTFKATRFERCGLREASFEGANLTGVVFRDCDLSRADLRNAKLTGTDFRGSNITGMQVGIKDLQGAVIAPSQAVRLATLLGILVKDEEP